MKESVRSKNLYRNSEGNWYYKKTINENRYKVSLNTKEINEADSKCDFLNDLPGLITSGEKSKQSKPPSFYEVCNHWFEHKKKSCLKSTIKSYQVVLNNYLFKATFSDKAIDTINKDEIDQWCNTFRETCSNSHFNKILYILSNIFNYARKMCWIEISPVGMIDRPKPNVNMPEPFTPKEVDTLLNNIDPFYRDYQEMLFFSFLRPSEISKLTPSDIDLSNKVIWIKRRKNSKSEKVISIPIDDRISNILSKQLEQAKKHGSETLFFNKNGKPINSAYYGRMVWKPLIEKAKI